MFMFVLVLILLVFITAGTVGMLAARKSIQEYNDRVEAEENLLESGDRDRDWISDQEQSSGSSPVKSGTQLVLVLLGLAIMAPSVMAQHSDTDILLGMHETVLQAHRDGDVEAWLSVEADTVLSVNNGTITRLTRTDRRSARSGYLLRATFDRYEDVRPPEVRISEDGTLGWVAVEVEVEGWMARDDGAIEDFAEAYAWVELYEKRDGRWVMTGNVSNSRDLE